MADVKISELPTGAASDADEMVIVDGAATKKISLSALSAYLRANGWDVTGTVTADGVDCSGHIDVGNAYSLRWGDGNERITGNNTGYMSFITNNTERARIDSSGNLLVGKTASSLFTVGAELTSTGQIYGTVSGSPVARLNRKTSDGDIVDFRKDDTVVGSIGAYGGELTLSSPAGGDAGIRMGYNAIKPATTAGANRDAAIDLGEASGRFRDMWLSGGIHLGGTGAANKLDDYETGTFTPTIVAGATNPVYSLQQGSYVKIGSFVWFSIDLQLSSGTPSGAHLQFGGLPFTSNAYGNLGFGAAAWSYGNMINATGLSNTLGIHVTYGGSNRVDFYEGAAALFSTNGNVSITGRAIVTGVYRTDQ
jgi:hypothetical protein